MAKSRQHIFYALVSFLCPLVTVIGTDAFQSIYYPMPENEPSYVGAMWGIAMGMQMLFNTLFACLVGLAFALTSILFNRRFFSIGTAAFVFNALPLAFALFFVIKSRTVGI
jgi:hypothetical protein